MLVVYITTYGDCAFFVPKVATGDVSGDQSLLIDTGCNRDHPLLQVMIYDASIYM